jgi:hypothetical protein
MAAVYNFNDIIQGTTLEARVFACKRYVNDQLVDLTSCVVKFQVFRSSTSRLYIDEDSQTGIVNIQDASLCLVEIGEIKDIQLTAATYYWHLLIEYPDGDKKIFVGGKFNVLTIKDFSNV